MILGISLLATGILLSWTFAGLTRQGFERKYPDISQFTPDHPGYWMRKKAIEMYEPPKWMLISGVLSSIAAIIGAILLFINLVKWVLA